MEILRWISDVFFVLGVGIFAVLFLSSLKNRGAFDGFYFLFRLAFLKGKTEYPKTTERARQLSPRFIGLIYVCGAVCIGISFTLVLVLKKAYYA